MYGVRDVNELRDDVTEIDSRLCTFGPLLRIKILEVPFRGRNDTLGLSVFDNQYSILLARSILVSFPVPGVIHNHPIFRVLEFLVSSALEADSTILPVHVHLALGKELTGQRVNDKAAIALASGFDLCRGAGLWSRSWVCERIRIGTIAASSADELAIRIAVSAIQSLVVLLETGLGKPKAWKISIAMATIEDLLVATARAATRKVASTMASHGDTGSAAQSRNSRMP